MTLSEDETALFGVTQSIFPTVYHALNAPLQSEDTITSELLHSVVEKVQSQLDNKSASATGQTGSMSSPAWSILANLRDRLRLPDENASPDQLRGFAKRLLGETLAHVNDVRDLVTVKALEAFMKQASYPGNTEPDPVPPRMAYGVGPEEMKIARRITSEPGRARASVVGLNRARINLQTALSERTLTNIEITERRNNFFIRALDVERELLKGRKDDDWPGEQSR